MITGTQIRMARAALDWSREDLAEKVDLTATSIKNIESGTVTPREKSLDEIVKALELAGLEFTQNNGVKFRDKSVIVYDGDKASDLLREDIFSTLKNAGGEILISGLDEKKPYFEYKEKVLAHIKRLQDNGIKERILVREGDEFFIAPRDWYRWMPSDLFDSTAPYYIYGNKVAIKIWGPPQQVVIFNNKLLAEAYRKEFEYWWKKGETQNV